MIKDAKENAPSILSSATHWGAKKGKKMKFILMLPFKILWFLIKLPFKIFGGITVKTMGGNVKVGR